MMFEVPTVEVTRCTGHCCEAFTLPEPPDVLEWLARIAAGEIPVEWNNPHCDVAFAGQEAIGAEAAGVRRYQDLVQIQAMVAYIGPTPIADAPDGIRWRPGDYFCADGTTPNEVTLVEVDELNRQGHRAHWYRCTNLLPDGNCGIYETRPAMCRNYPYRGDRCGYASCTRTCRAKTPAELEAERSIEIGEWKVVGS